MVVADRERQRADVLLGGGRPDRLLLRRGAPARAEMLHHLRYPADHPCAIKVALGRHARLALELRGEKQMARTSFAFAYDIPTLPNAPKHHMSSDVSSY